MDRWLIQWVINNLKDKDYQIQSNSIDVIQSNPWSAVYRIKTNKGYVFLKQVPSLLLLEPKIIKLLRNEFHANVPLMIAESKEHNCFLMEDAGIRLYDYFKNSFHEDIFIETMQLYAKLQIDSSSKIEKFFNLGVPDWRVKKLPSLYQLLISQESLLLKDGLTRNDLLKLNQLHEKLTSLCEKLLLYKIANTFGHADFHDKNILINPNTYETSIIDLGEVVITHPFFSLHNCLYRAKENFNLSINQHNQLLCACLEPWLEIESMENLLNLISIVNQCWPIHSVLGEYQLMKSINHVDFQKSHREGRFSSNLRLWLNQY